MKLITKFDPELVRRAVNRIAEPVIQTLTPLGNNVMFEKDLYSVITNDGATIAKLIDSEDETEDAIIQVVKYGSLATNQAAGDGTSTTILLTKKLVDIGLQQIEGGVKPMNLKKLFTDIKDKILENSVQFKNNVDNKNLYDIALVSSSGDEVLAKNVTEIIETSGVDGMIFINESKTAETNIIKDTGYNIDEPMLDPVLGNISMGRADYTKCHAFITDKKLYHLEEAREILESAYKFGVSNLVIVARDFVGESAHFLVAQHMDERVPMSVLLIKYPTPDNDFTQLNDLALYLGGEVTSEKIGNFKGKLTADNYILVDRAYSHGKKTVLVSDKKINPELTMLVDEVRKAKEADPNDTKVAKRLAALTAGTVTVEVGATTGPEMRELIFRYEDAINASRAALKSGFVGGGGITLFDSTRNLELPEKEREIAQDFGTASVEQIAVNCGVDFDISKYGGGVGYNARTNSYEHMIEAGIIEPYDVFKYSVANAFSVAIAILTSGFFIVNKNKDNGNGN